MYSFPTFPKASPTDIMQKSKKTRNDIIFISALLVVIALFSLVLFATREKGDKVVVTIDGNFFAEYPLDTDIEVEIKSENGYNILIINDGRAYVESASCPAGIGVSHRPVSNGGESIICLPNKVVVEVHTTKENVADITV